MNKDPEQVSLLTIGHSTRPLEVFLSLIKDYAGEMVVDVRTVPRSRHVPQFNLETLPRALKSAGFGYVHLKGLGGFRHPVRNSLNLGWRNASFRGFADYMQTAEFRESLEELIDLVQNSRVVVMCAELLPWRCHRSLIADALSIRGFEVRHILDEDKIMVHKLTSWAKVEGIALTYPAIEHLQPDV